MSDSIQKLILGTAQFGLDYGINNPSGRVPEVEVEKILKTAFKNGIRVLDTAEAYGKSQSVLGEFSAPFQMMTKFQYQKLNGLTLKENLKQTLKTLKKSSLYCYSFHSFEDSRRQEAIQDLVQFKQEGLIENIGVSLYTNLEFREAINSEWVDIIQMPFNLLDNFEKRGELLKLAKLHNKIIHVRSIFLQGLFFKDLQSLHSKLAPLIPYLEKINTTCQQLNINIEEACLLYPLAFEEIDGVVFGVDNRNHLISNLQGLKRSLSSNFVDLISRINVLEEDLLQPKNW